MDQFELTRDSITLQNLRQEERMQEEVPFHWNRVERHKASIFRAITDNQVPALKYLPRETRARYAAIIEYMSLDSYEEEIMNQQVRGDLKVILENLDRRKRELPKKGGKKGRSKGSKSKPKNSKSPVCQRLTRSYDQAMRRSQSQNKFPRTAIYSPHKNQRQGQQKKRNLSKRNQRSHISGSNKKSSQSNFSDIFFELHNTKQFLTDRLNSVQQGVFFKLAEEQQRKEKQEIQMEHRLKDLMISIQQRILIKIAEEQQRKEKKEIQIQHRLGILQKEKDPKGKGGHDRFSEEKESPLDLSSILPPSAEKENNLNQLPSVQEQSSVQEKSSVQKQQHSYSYT